MADLLVMASNLALGRIISIPVQQHPSAVELSPLTAFGLACIDNWDPYVYMSCKYDFGYPRVHYGTKR